MKRTLFMVLIVVHLLACKKEVSPPVFDTFFSRVLVCDSIRKQTDEVITTHIFGKGKGEDLLFTPTQNSGKYGTVGSYQKFSTPATTTRFRYERPEKIYFWNINSTIHEGDYFTIAFASGKKLVLQHLDIGTKNRQFYYYTAE